MRWQPGKQAEPTVSRPLMEKNWLDLGQKSEDAGRATSDTVL